MKNFCYHDESEEEIHTTNSIAKVKVFKGESDIKLKFWIAILGCVRI